MHRFDTDHECDGRTDRQTDRRPDDGKDARSILLSRVIKFSVTHFFASLSPYLSVTCFLAVTKLRVTVWLGSVLKLMPVIPAVSVISISIASVMAVS